MPTLTVPPLAALVIAAVSGDGGDFVVTPDAYTRVEESFLNVIVDETVSYSCTK